MKMINKVRVSENEVKKWLYDNIRDLTETQKRWIRDEEIVRFAPFEFYKTPKRVTNVFYRFSVILLPIVWTLLMVLIPFKFLLTGKWGYDNLEWWVKWVRNCGVWT